MRTLSSTWRFVLALSISAMGVACSSSESDAGSPEPPVGGAKVGCAEDARVMTFASGLTAKDASGRLAAEVVTASPSPPIKGMNSWTLHLTADGQPLKDIPTVTTLMPDHGHGSTRTPKVVANPDGTFTVSDLYLSMGGVWEISIVDPASVTPAKFSICVQ